MRGEEPGEDTSVEGRDRGYRWEGRRERGESSRRGMSRGEEKKIRYVCVEENGDEEKVEEKFSEGCLEKTRKMKEVEDH